MMDYNDFTDWMFRLERFGIKLGLENVTEFLSRIGRPQNDFKSIHVTGTNGKGSVCKFTSEILRRHGLHVGLYTSPHLVDFRERILIDGNEISEEDVLRIGIPLKRVMEKMADEDKEMQLTFFEFTTGMAFKYFAEKNVDMVVAEVGMGGRLDATNVISPEVAAITRIGLEHTNYLGSTIPDIAREKAGIVKADAKVVTCERNREALSVIETACKRKGATLKRINKDFDVSNVRQSLKGTTFDYAGGRKLTGLRTHMLGTYQAENAACAIAIVEELTKKDIFVVDDDIKKGLLSARWPGRLDIVSRDPLVVFDGSHNPDGVLTTVNELKDLKITPLTYVLGCMDDKDVRGIVKAIVPSSAKIVCTQSKYKRAFSAKALQNVVREEFGGPNEMFEDSEIALERGFADMEGKGMCVIGSLYLVGEALLWWQSSGKSRIGAAHKV
jgi:dihydrofolate synthase/folylpolyglutamate synthase